MSFEHEMIPRLFLSLLLGAMVGLEREFTQKSAGLRTHILVTLGATIFTIVSISNFFYHLSGFPYEAMASTSLSVDPSRVAAQIVTGIGFIGGGAVLRSGRTIQGLTTAASLWSMASIGMLVGIGQFSLATTATLIILMVLFTIGRVERQYMRKARHAFNRMRVHIVARLTEASTPQMWMDDHYKEMIIEVKTKSDAETAKVELTYILEFSSGKMDVNSISKYLCRVDGVLNSTVKAYYEPEDIN